MLDKYYDAWFLGIPGVRGVIRRSSTIAIIVVCLNWSSAVSQELTGSERTTTQPRCEPIGRVLTQGDRLPTAGSLICKEDRLHLPRGATVDVLCFLNKRVLKLSSSVVSDKCVPQATEVIPCSAGDRSNCPKPKGPGDVNSPALISPYSSALLNGRPLLSWYAIPGATSYTVKVSGEGVSWQKTVEGTTLPYPNEPAMQFGNAYKITILANQGDSPVSASVSVVHLLPENEAKQLMAIVERIKSLNLPKDEAAFLDLDTVYMSRKLLNETIETLKARIKAGSQNPAIYRVLGDRYLEAGLPDYAKQQYEVATTLAKRADNSAELAKAQAGLKRAELYSQLPTRINGAQ